ncbi:hypothetical protein [Nonomuraea dietziae]|uniref:hypothetical protein n=1 Tax=Nonomuraea dietziae TaxID=65515 RepID=UPI003CD0C12A
MLDPALLRPGRFDRTVMVAPPDAAGRVAILRVHTRGVPLDGDVSLEQLAKTSPGMTGADLANLVNEAALLAAKRGKEKVSAADFADALEKLQLGAVRSIVMPEEERTRTAYHEAGHALLGMLQPGADPVRKISIIPRGRALGVTLSTPDTDRYAYDEKYLRGRIIGALGGMAAEQVIYGVITHGRGERPRAGHDDRPWHGRQVGHVGEDRPAQHPAQRRPAAGRPAHPRRPGRGGAQDRRRVLRGRHEGPHREPRQARGDRPGAAGTGDARRGAGLRGRGPPARQQTRRRAQAALTSPWSYPGADRGSFGL